MEDLYVVYCLPFNLICHSFYEFTLQYVAFNENTCQYNIKHILKNIYFLINYAIYLIELLTYEYRETKL